MARPKNKSELLNASQHNFNRLKDFIDSISPEEREKRFPAGTMNRSISDVLCHLHHWHLMMLDWYKVGMAGDRPDIPAKGYSWKTTPELNRMIWEKYQETPLHEAIRKFDASHQQVHQLITNHSEEELFEKRRYKWTGTTSLGAYLISATSSHYDWAYKLIKKAKK